MANPSVSFDGTRVSAAESNTDGGNWDRFDTAQNPVNETDVFYQGTQGLSNKVNATATGGLELANSTGTHDFAGGGAGGADRACLFKVIVTNQNALDAQGATGLIMYLGSGTTTDRYLHYWHGNGTYPIAGGWVFGLWDPNIAGYRDATNGTPDLNNVDFFAVSAEFSVAARSENIVMDAVDYIDVGTGLTLIGGDGASPDATFDDFVAFDEGTVGNRYGIVRTVEGILYVLGFLTVGTATETDFTDATGGTMVFVDGQFGPGTVGLRVDIQNNNSVFSCTGWSFVGRGSTTTADSRPDLEVTGAGTSASATFDRCSFRNFRQADLVVDATMSDCVFAEFDTIDAGDGATLAGSTITESSTAADSSAVIWDVNLDPNGELDNMSITKGTNAHHAIEFGLTSPLTMTLTGIDFSGFNASNAQNDSTFHVLRTTGTVTINIVGGSGNVSYKTAGATVVIVQNPVALTLTVVDNSNEAVISGARAYVLAAATGPLPFQDSVTITRVTTTATVAHTAHGFSVGQKVLIEGANQPEYNGIQTITAINVNDYDYTVSGSPTTPATGTITSTAVIISGTTNGSGVISDTRTYSSDQDFTGRVRDSTPPAPFYITQPISGTIDSANGLSVNVRLVRDE